MDVSFKTTSYYNIPDLMKEFIAKITALIGDGNLNEALLQMFNLLSLASSYLKNDAILLRGRFNKLSSDVRRGIIEKKDEMLEFNKILHSTLELLELMKEETPQLEGFLDDLRDSAERTNKVADEIKQASHIKNAPLSPQEMKALVDRMAFVNEKKLNLKGLWIDDNLGSISSEQRLIETIGLKFDFVQSSSEALNALETTPYNLIISDITRNSNPREGVDFLKTLVEDYKKRIPTIFYILNQNEKYGVPPYAFGVTNRPTELIHLVLDIIERI